MEKGQEAAFSIVTKIAWPLGRHCPLFIFEHLHMLILLDQLETPRQQDWFMALFRQKL